MDIMRDEVLNTIDSISDVNLTILESALDVYKALSDEYEKAVTVLEYYEGDDISSPFSIFQEESILDKATGKYTNDSVIKKIVWFIPRLLGAIVQAIAGIFTKDYKKDTETSLAKAESNIEICSEEQLSSLATGVNKVSEGNISFDPKTKKITLSEKFRNIKNVIVLLATVPPILHRIHQECKLDNTPYKKLAGELKAVITKKKKFDGETIAFSLSSLNQLMGDACKASLAVKSSCELISSILSKKIEKDLANGEDPEKIEGAKELLDHVSTISKHVFHVTLFGKIGKGAIDFLGQDASRAIGKYTPVFNMTEKGKEMAAKGQTGTEKIMSKLTEKARHSDDYDDIDDMKFENDSTRSKISATDTERKEIDKIHDIKNDVKGDNKYLDELKGDVETARDSAKTRKELDDTEFNDRRAAKQAKKEAKAKEKESKKDDDKRKGFFKFKRK